MTAVFVTVIFLIAVTVELQWKRLFDNPLLLHWSELFNHL
jgi:hypothetical protein